MAYDDSYDGLRECECCGKYYRPPHHTGMCSSCRVEYYDGEVPPAPATEIDRCPKCGGLFAVQFDYGANSVSFRALCEDCGYVIAPYRSDDDK